MSRGIRAVVLWIACAAFGVSGCVSTTISQAAGPRSYTADDYDQVYQAWTRTHQDYSWTDLQTVLNVSATFESHEFRWAYVVRYSRDHSLRTTAREAMLRATLADAQEQHRFFVTLVGDDYRQSNLTGRESAWRALLVDEHGEQTSPVEIERIRRPGALEETYFPSVSVHRHTFRITFPARRRDGSPTIASNANHVILRFAGPLGMVDLQWDFAEPAAD